MKDLVSLIAVPKEIARRISMNRSNQIGGELILACAACLNVPLSWQYSNDVGAFLRPGNQSNALRNGAEAEGKLR